MSKRMIALLDNHIEDITATTHTIIGSFTDESGTARSVTLLSNDAFKEYLDSLYWDRYYSFKKEDEETVDAAVVRTFNKKWNIFLEENEHNINRIAEALYTYYNPLYNYNKSQHTVNVRSGSETYERENNFGATSNTLSKTGSDQLTNQYGATQHNTAESGSILDTHANGQKQTNSAVTTMDSNNFSDTGKVTEAAVTDTDTRSYNNHQVTETDAARTDTATRSFNNYQEASAGAAHTDSGEDTKTYNDVTDEFTDDTHGNIGVMESVTMIESELKLRKTQIGKELLQRFLDIYTYRL